MEYTAAHMIGLGQSTLAPLKTNLEAIKDQIFGQHLILVEWNEHLSAVGIRKFLKEALESEKEFTNPSFSRELQRLAQTSQELCLKLKTQIHLQQCVEEKLLLLCEQLHETIAEAAVDWVGKLTWSELFQRIDRSLKNFFPADHTNLEWDASLLQKDQTFAPPPFDLATLQQLILLGSAALATQSQSLLEPRNLRFSIRFFHPGSRSGLKLKLVRHSALGGHYMVLPADGQRYIQLMQMHLGLKAASVTLEPDSGNGAVILISWERPMDLRQSLRQNLQKSPSLHHD